MEEDYGQVAVIWQMHSPPGQIYAEETEQENGIQPGCQGDRPLCNKRRVSLSHTIFLSAYPPTEELTPPLVGANPSNALLSCYEARDLMGCSRLQVTALLTAAARLPLVAGARIRAVPLPAGTVSCPVGRTEPRDRWRRRTPTRRVDPRPGVAWRPPPERRRSGPGPR